MVAQVNRSIMHSVQIVQGVSNAPRAYHSIVQWFDCINNLVATDFACGTGGFLVSALNELYDESLTSNENKEIYNNTVYGVEKKALPHILYVTNMLLHDIDNPEIIHGNTLETDYKEYRKMEKFDLILMNPPYGGNEKNSVKVNFPVELRSSETADLFMDIIMFRLKKNGRCGIILPDGFFVWN